jgi:hypothetical protein
MGVPDRETQKVQAGDQLEDIHTVTVRGPSEDR